MRPILLYESLQDMKKNLVPFRRRYLDVLMDKCSIMGCGGLIIIMSFTKSLNFQAFTGN